MSMEAQQDVTNLFKGSGRRKCTHAILKVILTQFTAFRESSDKWTVILSSVVIKLKIYGWYMTTVIIVTRSEERWKHRLKSMAFVLSNDVLASNPMSRNLIFRAIRKRCNILCHLFVAEEVPLCEAQLLLSLNKQLHDCDHQCWQVCSDSSSLCSVVIGPNLRICPLQDLASLSGPESNSIQWGLEKVWE